jgi:prepilin-type N-terminal cleavage/methylation domain-containing protein
MTEDQKRSDAMGERANRPSASSSRGFTLVELMVVIGILAIMAAIAVPSFHVMERNRDRSTCAANLKAIGQALAIFRQDYNCYPPDATEFVWTEEALESYRSQYGADPPGDHRLGTPLGAAYHPDGTPFQTDVKGMGLYTLYYLGAYAAALPPLSLEPRLDREVYPSVDVRGGLSQFDWFRGSGYITKQGFFHCPANDAKLDFANLLWRQTEDRPGVPYLGGWANYDMFYRRNFWHEGYQPSEGSDNRNLFQAYPPVDTVITWCPYHHSSNPPAGPGVISEVRPGDEDLVLFADGSVRRMVSSTQNRVFEDPSGDFGFPRGPIM